MNLKPSELNGALHVWLVPLACPSRGLSGVQSVTPDVEESPFLPARATLAAKSERVWDGTPVPSFWSWPTPVLLAAAEVQRDNGSPVTFGRSVRTLAEDSDWDQPLVATESSSCSLWHVPGMGLVLGLERLVVLGASGTTPFGGQADQLGAKLVEPLDKEQRRLQQGPMERRDAADASDLLEYFTGNRSCSLRTLFGDAVSDLERLNKAVAELLIPRRTAIAGARQVEGLLVSLASSTEPLGIDTLLLRGHPDKASTFEESDHEQEAGFLWQYQPVSMAQEPADPSAVCALRSDGHVAVLDLDAFSIYHDYLDGAAGGHTLTTLIPLAALLGQRAQDFWVVADGIRGLAEAGAQRATADHLLELRELREAAQDVRVRMELRRLLQEQLFNEPSFVTWTNPEHLRRAMARLALADVVRADDVASRVDDPLTGSLTVLDTVLQRQMREAELELQRVNEEESQKTRSVLQGIAGVVAGAGLLGLFAALAAVPDGGRVIGSLVSAALWTLLAATLLGSITAVGWSLLKRQAPRQPRRRRLLRTAVGTGGSVAVAACAGGLVVDAPLDSVLLGVAGLAFLAGAGFLLWLLPSPGQAAAPS